MSQQQQIKGVFPTIEYLEGLLDDHSWTLVKEKRDKSGNHIIGYHHPPLGPRSEQKCYKVISFQNATLDSLLSLFHSRLPERIKEFCSTCFYCRVVDKIDEDTYVMHQKYKLPFPMSPRDMVVAHTKVVLPNGSVALIERSIEYPSLPPEKSIVRAETLVFVRLLVPKDGGVYMTNMQWGLTKLPPRLVDFGAIDSLIEEAEVTQRVFSKH
eukprot:TRINITY_DN446_c0_g2_i1.p1 TRINITY_DN446_c0_g2~~TRINITY_DN446_c0_g2_i1.p1  ORF type:complete len:211 (+),score=39.17 TRINITY_DN446_c0_g2_i1:233-865(+)